jgi:hypothetical protein
MGLHIRTEAHQKTHEPSKPKDFSAIPGHRATDDNHAHVLNEVGRQIEELKEVIAKASHQINRGELNRE